LTTPLGTLPLLGRVDDLLPNLFKLGMLGIVVLNPASGAVPLALEVHEVTRSAVHLAGDAVPESVKFRHFPRGTLGHLAYEFDPIGVNRLHISESGVEKEGFFSPHSLY